MKPSLLVHATQEGGGVGGRGEGRRYDRVNLIYKAEHARVIITGALSRMFCAKFPCKNMSHTVYTTVCRARRVPEKYYNNKLL